MSLAAAYIVLGYITVLGCQSLLEASPVPNTSEGQGQTAHDDYTYTPGVGYHKFHTQMVDWSTARRICRAEGAHLAIINSEAEAELLSQLLTQPEIPGFETLLASHTIVYVRQAAVGLHDLFEEGEWVSIHDESLAETGFAEWDYMGPNRLQNCGVLRSTKKLKDVPCSRKQAFICELPSLPKADLQTV